MTAPLTVQIIAVEDDPDNHRMPCNEAPEKAYAIGVYITNPKLFLVSVEEVVAGDWQTALEDALCFAEALAVHMGVKLENRVMQQAPAPAAPRVTIRCSRCQSTDVMRDAWAVWDDDAQAWELGTVFDAGHCDACEGDARLVEQPL
jgi:hypothetical protein